MAGNSQRKGAVRKPGSKKGAVVGSGGNGRRALEGKGPTPKAEERPGHVAYRRKQREDVKASAPRRQATRAGGRGSLTEVIAGRNPVLEALRAGLSAEGLRVFNHIDADERISESLRMALEADIEVREVTKPELDALTGGASHQGIALVVAPFDYAEPGDLLDVGGIPLIVALDSIQDPRNLGAIMRSAVAFGATGVLIPERRAAGVTAAAWKTSAGAAARIPVARATNLVRALEDLKSRGCFVVGLAADGELAIGASDLLNGPVVLVVGSEGKGLSRLVRQTCDQVAAIPISSEAESLNASVAASVALYEAARSR